MSQSAGSRFRQAVAEERPLQVMGCINAYVALLAQRAGYRAIYLSGAGVANASYGLPDLGVTTLDNVVEDAGRITQTVDLPLLVDIDTGWGPALMIARSIRALERAGVAAVHIEDQVAQKRCGHRPGKALVDTDEMCDRIRAAVDARIDEQFVVMARTDAFANEGLDGAIERCCRYREAGADMLFPEALNDLEQYRAIREAAGIPILANITEFGATPLFTTSELSGAGVDIALYPLSPARAMYRAADEVMKVVRKEGTQQACIETMQTREELYEVLDYHKYEEIYDKLTTE